MNALRCHTPVDEKPKKVEIWCGDSEFSHWTSLLKKNGIRYSIGNQGGIPTTIIWNKQELAIHLWHKYLGFEE